MTHESRFLKFHIRVQWRFSKTALRTEKNRLDFIEHVNGNQFD